jgi:hypothetical protein
VEGRRFYGEPRPHGPGCYSFLLSGPVPRRILPLVLLVALASPLTDQPTEPDGVFVRLVDTLPPATVGIAYEPTEAAIYVLAGSDDLSRKPLASEGPARVRPGVEVDRLAAGRYLTVVEASGARGAPPDRGTLTAY